MFLDGADGDSLTQQKGDNVTLMCAEIREDEQFGGALWYKGDIFLVWPTPFCALLMLYAKWDICFCSSQDL